MSRIYQKSFLLFLSFCSSSVFANGFYAFNHSNNSFGLAGAYQSQALGVDAAYYNPANLVFIKESEGLWEFDGIVAHQPQQAFRGTINLPVEDTPASGQADAINAVMPYVFYVSPENNNWRWGLSTTYQGVTSQWGGQPQAFLVGSATVATFILSPVVSYKVSEQFSIGGGLQMTYSMLEQSSQGNLFGPDMSLDLNADGFDLSHILATTYKVNQDFTLSAVYRSATETTLKGDAQALDGIDNYDGAAEIDALTPALFRLSGAYEFNDTIVEFVASRVLWSEYDSIQLRLDRQLTGPASLYQAKAEKNWRDVDTVHLGLTHRYNDKTTLLMGLSQDLGTAAPEESINFDWLDGKVSALGLGVRYQYSKDYQVGASYNYSYYSSSKVSNAIIDGEYDRNVHVIGFFVSSSF
ncbi:outer membrane protein transport protein [Thiomicrorhabdus sp. 6S2-11]|uniref:Outer membrane protein transport protein n=1 Tax=Thiomicrorhabdus marina TaxID=2818442 RepID=A0ABS3Q5H5_9GAMM|nr:outer membrane protein transport protein [Thiomicrorhabdus marina]MBO1927585.1 outer membrane protein transport protein [Thiomicrorhabdus marina]